MKASSPWQSSSQVFPVRRVSFDIGESHLDIGESHLDVNDPGKIAQDIYQAKTSHRVATLSDALASIGERVVTNVSLTVPNPDVAANSLKMSFDFDKENDTALGVAKELVATGVVAPDSSLEGLAKIVEDAVIFRCKEITLSSCSPAFLAALETIGVASVQDVRLAVNSSQGRFRINFCFNPLDDTPLTIARELQQSGIVGVPRQEDDTSDSNESTITSCSSRNSRTLGFARVLPGARWTRKRDIPATFLPRRFARTVLLRTLDIADRCPYSALVLLGDPQDLSLGNAKWPAIHGFWSSAELSVFDPLPDEALDHFTKDGAVVVDLGTGKIHEMTVKVEAHDDAEWSVEGGCRTSAAFSSTRTHRCVAVCKKLKPGGICDVRQGWVSLF